jgi:hypothetical protein
VVVERGFLVVKLWWIVGESWQVDGHFSGSKNMPLFPDLFFRDSHFGNFGSASKTEPETEPYSSEVPFHIAVILTLSEAERGRGPAFSPVAPPLLTQRHRQGATFFTDQTSNRKAVPSVR